MRVLIVAAHPDDETIGASTLLHGPHEVTILHVTDGAPRDPRWWPAATESREAYADQRHRELALALARTNVPPARMLRLGFVDQETCHGLRALARAIAEHVAEARPELVVTHAYEGGHPDHDSVAFAVAEARAVVPDPPRVIEMALYHGARGALCAGEFLPGTRAPATHVLTDEERRRRAEMLGCFASQRETLAPFLGVRHERFRVAPAYDFARPPHAGPLLYERTGFTTAGAEWRELAALAHERHAP